MPDHPTVNFEAMWELENSRRILAEADQDLTPHAGESTADWTARVERAAEAQVRLEAQAKAQAELAKRPGESPEQWAARIKEWQARNAQQEQQTTAKKPPVRPDNPTDLYSESARDQLLADIRSGKATPPTTDDGPVSLADPALYSDDARAKLLDEARKTAARAAVTNTPRG